MVESRVDAHALDTRASGGDCVDQLSKVLKCSCHLASTDALSDSFPSGAFNRADEAAHFSFSCRNEAKASLILTRACYLLHPLLLIMPQ